MSPWKLAPRPSPCLFYLPLPFLLSLCHLRVLVVGLRSSTTSEAPSRVKPPAMAESGSVFAVPTAELGYYTVDRVYWDSPLSVLTLGSSWVNWDGSQRQQGRQGH